MANDDRLAYSLIFTFLGDVYSRPPRNQRAIIKQENI